LVCAKFPPSSLVVSASDPTLRWPDGGSPLGSTITPRPLVFGFCPLVAFDDVGLKECSSELVASSLEKPDTGSLCLFLATTLGLGELGPSRGAPRSSSVVSSSTVEAPSGDRMGKPLALGETLPIRFLAYFLRCGGVSWVLKVHESRLAVNGQTIPY
jgi:hypothetical protein